MQGAPVAFGPRIDVERKYPFLPKHPVDIIKSGSFNHVPFITGVNSNEAGFIVASQFINLILSWYIHFMHWLTPILFSMANKQNIKKGMLSRGIQELDKFQKDPVTLIKFATGTEFNPKISKPALDVFENYFPDKSMFNPNSLEEVNRSNSKLTVDHQKLKKNNTHSEILSSLVAAFPINISAVSTDWFWTWFHHLHLPICIVPDDFGRSIFQVCHWYGEAAHAAQLGTGISLFIRSPRSSHFPHAVLIQRHSWIW